MLVCTAAEHTWSRRGWILRMSQYGSSNILSSYDNLMGIIQGWWCLFIKWGGERAWRYHHGIHGVQFSSTWKLDSMVDNPLTKVMLFQRWQHLPFLLAAAAGHVWPWAAAFWFRIVSLCLVCFWTQYATVKPKLKLPVINRQLVLARNLGHFCGLS